MSSATFFITYYKRVFEQKRMCVLVFSSEIVLFRLGKAHDTHSRATFPVF